MPASRKMLMVHFAERMNLIDTLFAVSYNIFHNFIYPRKKSLNFMEQKPVHTEKYAVSFG